eukprot:CAMPEP_0114491260 /NCGR_PEP_ID=MMETSP0109-20121206/2903_1 /TAXON_ID=29199 /ORGANISM="Chlorarachnion reptans, Strain CCCM449" /LENGTH=398 /DNA_ID=CAMNT_0001667977 /DNA_START=291 /DNA_END=1487 /DNA_ORIENTATION=+
MARPGLSFAHEPILPPEVALDSSRSFKRIRQNAELEDKEKDMSFQTSDVDSLLDEMEMQNLIPLRNKSKNMDDLAAGLRDASLSQDGPEREEYLADENDPVKHKLYLQLDEYKSMHLSNITEIGTSKTSPTSRNCSKSSQKDNPDESEPSVDESWIRTFKISSDDCTPLILRTRDGSLNDADDLYLHSFPSSLAMGMIIHADPKGVANKSVLELGSAQGFASIVASNYARSVTISTTSNRSSNAFALSQCKCLASETYIDPKQPETFCNDNRTYEAVIVSEGVHVSEGMMHIGHTTVCKRLARTIRYHLPASGGRLMLMCPKSQHFWRTLLDELAEPHLIEEREATEEDRTGVVRVYTSKTVNASVLHFFLASGVEDDELNKNVGEYIFLHAQVEGYR